MGLWYGPQCISRLNARRQKCEKPLVIFFVACLSSLAVGQAADLSQPATKQDVMVMFQEMRFEEQMKGIQQSVAQQFQGMANQVMQRTDIKSLTPEKQKKFRDLMEQEMRQSMNVYPVSEMIDGFRSRLCEVFDEGRCEGDYRLLSFRGGKEVAGYFSQRFARGDGHHRTQDAGAHDEVNGRNAAARERDFR